MEHPCWGVVGNSGEKERMGFPLRLQDTVFTRASEILSVSASDHGDCRARCGQKLLCWASMEVNITAGKPQLADVRRNEL